ncbi:MAG: outer membrane beta-barrel protein [Desulforhopalus sp.]|nr:outer membrane beta-barrel protein [Desulforhopalus sp.]
MGTFNRNTIYCILIALTLAPPAYAVAAVTDETPVAPAVNASPMEQEDTSASLLPEEELSPAETLFGRETGYLHPFLRSEESWTDNIFYSNEDEVGSWLTHLVPGMWLTLPRSKNLPVSITPDNTSPAGLQAQINDEQLGTERYQAFILGDLDSSIYSEDSNLNSTGGDVQGLFRYNMRGGLSLQGLDAYKDSNDSFRDTSSSNRSVRYYDSNLAMATADYRISEKFRVKTDYSNFSLDYDDSSDSALNRDDNAMDLYTYFIYSVKTSLFLEYKFVDVNYDTASEKDSNQHYFYTGMDWKKSDKVKLHAKAGYQKREYDDSVTSLEDWGGLAFDLGADYRMSSKTTFTLAGYRRSDESGSTVALYKTATGIRLGYNQELSPKITAMINGLWENADYTNDDNSDRTDNRYQLAPALQYSIYDWMMTKLTYSWDYRTSDSDIYEYTTNMLMLSLNISM